MKINKLYTAKSDKDNQNLLIEIGFKSHFFILCIILLNQK